MAPRNRHQGMELKEHWGSLQGLWQCRALPAGTVQSLSLRLGASDGTQKTGNRGELKKHWGSLQGLWQCQALCAATVHSLSLRQRPSWGWRPRSLSEKHLHQGEKSKSTGPHYLDPGRLSRACEASGGGPPGDGVHGHAIAEADDERVLLRRAHALWSPHLQQHTPL